jgi:hypothetical protein
MSNALWQVPVSASAGKASSNTSEQRTAFFMDLYQEREQKPNGLSNTRTHAPSQGSTIFPGLFGSSFMAGSLRTFALIAAAATVATLQVNAAGAPGRGQRPPGRPMPPDLVAPASAQPQPQPHTPTAAAQAQPKAAPAMSAAPSGPQKAAKSAGKRRAKKPAPQPEPVPIQPDPGPPPPPPTPQQMQPSPPNVSFGDGLLTISANNSTLADVLAAIRKQTGASIELPPGAGRDRVFAQIGPAPPRDAVTALLTGSAYDYVIVGAPDDPRALRQVLLTPRSADGAGAGMSAAPMAPRPQVSRLPGMGEAPGTAAAEDDEDKAQAQPQVTPQNPAAATPNGATPAPAAQAQPTGQTPVQPAGDTPNAQAPGAQQPKTPQQYLEELNRLKQQQQAKPPKPNQ